MRWMCLWLVFLLAGCAGPMVAPPPQDTRDRMYQVVVHVSAVPQTLLEPDEQPVAGGKEGAAYGAKSGAVTAVGVGAATGLIVGCQPVWGPLIIITCPVGLVGGTALGVAAAIPSAAIGAAVGSSKAQAEEKVAETAVTFAKIIESTNVSEKLRDRLLTSIESMTDTTVAASPEDSASGYVSGPEDHSGIIIDVVIEQAALTMAGRLEPDLYIEIAAKARLREPSRPGWIYERAWSYYGELGEYFLLLDEDGAGLRREIDSSFAKVADAIVVDLFLSNEQVAPMSEGRKDRGRVVTTSGPLVLPEKGAKIGGG